MHTIISEKLSGRKAKTIALISNMKKLAVWSRMVPRKSRQPNVNPSNALDLLDKILTFALNHFPTSPAVSNPADCRSFENPNNNLRYQLLYDRQEKEPAHIFRPG